MSDIEWMPVVVRLGDLAHWAENPVTLTKAQAKKLLKSTEKLGRMQTLAIGPADGDGKHPLYDGHQRVNVWGGAFGMDLEVNALQSNRPLTDDERHAVPVMLRTATGSFDWDALSSWPAEDLTQWGMDDNLLTDWKRDIAALGNLIESEGAETEEKKIGHEGRLYNAGEGHDIEPFKLAYRVEAIYKSRGKLALDLFSGAGQLAAWYRRRFEHVVTVDKNYDVGDVDYSMSALSFIKNLLRNYLDFDFVDFDDEGCPHEEIKALFAFLSGKKADSFVLALTDGQGLNLKCRGRFNPETYLLDGEQRKATQEDYEHFEEIVTGFVERCANRHSFVGTQLSSYRGRENNVVYQTWLIEVLPSLA